MCDNGHCKDGGKFFVGMIAGVAVTVGGYYFLTKTEKGKKVKKELKKKTEKLAADLKEVVEEIEDRGAELKKGVLKAGNELTHLDELQDRVESLRDRGRRAVKFFTANGKKLG
jgi:gas vesicle protein